MEIEKGDTKYPISIPSHYPFKMTNTITNRDSKNSLEYAADPVHSIYIREYNWIVTSKLLHGIGPTVLFLDTPKNTSEFRPSHCLENSLI